MQGWRLHHEDAHEMICDDKVGTFWVLDGHGGDSASIYCAPELASVHRELLGAEKPGKLPEDDVVCKAFEATDLKYLASLKNPDQAAGSTVVGTVVAKQEDGTYSLKILNAGDSRALVISGPGDEESVMKSIRISRPEEVKEDHPTWPLLVESIDHKPDRDIEKARILAAGGSVSSDDCPRLDGNLAVSRGMGDFEYKDTDRPAAERKVSCIPEIYEVHGLREGSIVVLACDGLWDVLQNDQVAAAVRDQLKENPKSDLGVMAARLIREALDKQSRDNITCMIVQLSDGSEWSEKSNRFNASDEMMYFEKLIQNGSAGLDEESTRAWRAFLTKCNFPALPVQCSVSGRWFRLMFKCPGTDNVYMSRHCQKKGWAARKRAAASKDALEKEGESW